MAPSDISNNFNLSQVNYPKDDSKKIESPVILLPEICPCEDNPEEPFKTTVTPNDTDSSGKIETINVDSSLKLGSSKLIHSFLVDVPQKNQNNINPMIPENNSTIPTNQRIEMETFAYDLNQKSPLKAFYSEDSNGNAETGIISELNFKNFNLIAEGKNTTDSTGTVTRQKSASVSYFPTSESQYFSSETRLSVVNTTGTPLTGTDIENNEISLMYGGFNFKNVKNTRNDGNSTDAYDLSYIFQKTSISAKKTNTNSGNFENQAKLNQKIETSKTEVALTYTETNNDGNTSYVSNLAIEQAINDSKLSASYTSKLNDKPDFEIAYNYRDTVLSKYTSTGNNKVVEAIYTPVQNAENTDSLNRIGVKHSLNSDTPNATEIFGEGNITIGNTPLSVKASYSDGEAKVAYLEASLNKNSKENEKLSVKLNHDSTGSSGINAEYSLDI